MKEVKKTIKEYDEEGNLIKETIIEKEEKVEDNKYPYVPWQPYQDIPNDPIHWYPIVTCENNGDFSQYYI